MPDLLVLSHAAQELEKLTILGESKGFRVKGTLEYKTALEWLKLRGFDLVFLPASVSITGQQELAGYLWERNSRARLIVYDLDENSHVDKREVRLYGAELAKGRDAQQQLARIMELPFSETGADNRDFRIMVVEDLDSPRDIICFFLESLGYPSVSGFSSAAEAMGELQKDPQRYSCIITDIRMPQMSGDQLIQLIRKDPKLCHLPVVVLTAYGTVDCLVDCLRAGASGFLVKPPKKRDLTRELARATRIKAGETGPRLISENDAEAVKDILVKREGEEGW